MSRSGGVVVLVAAGALTIAFTSCGHPQRGPADALADFGAAIDRQDYAAA